MKKIIIVSHAMELGGAENALLGLLEHIDTTTYQVDLFLLGHRGELLPYIPAGINLLPEKPEYACMAVPIGTAIRKKQFSVVFRRMVGKYKAKRRVAELGYSDSDIELEYSHKYTCSVMPMISEESYDLAISFLTPHYYVAEKIHAGQKLAWIHTDYSVVQVDRASQLQMWNRYDGIISISDKVTESFVGVFPELEAKIWRIENMLPVRYILSKAGEFGVEAEMPDDGAVKLLSVGRFCTAKNFDNIPAICRMLCEAGINLKWYLIGYGGDEPLIRQSITEAGMGDRVVILGKKENPYPYIKACDLYVQPSRYEGKCVSVREAQLLGKPVVITRYATSASQLEDGVDGVIVPMDNAGCANGIAQLLQDRERLALLSANCAERDYANAGETEKIYRMLC